MRTHLIFVPYCRSSLKTFHAVFRPHRRAFVNREDTIYSLHPLDFYTTVLIIWIFLNFMNEKFLWMYFLAKSKINTGWAPLINAPGFDAQSYLRWKYQRIP
jgi:hypothetical protein